MNPKKIGIMVGAGIAAIVLLSMVGNLFETNQMGYYQVKQAAFSGTTTVRNEPGTYGQWLGDIYTYHISDTIDFSKENNLAIKVKFNDGSFADVSGTLRFRLSSIPEKQIRLHADFKAYQNVITGLLQPVVKEALLQTASLMKAEELYSTRRAEFTSLAEEQIRMGLYETTSIEKKTQDVEGNDFIERQTTLKLVDGKRVISKPSPLRDYGIEIISFIVKDVDFDDTIEKLIAKKKEAEQQKVVARANAERAKQDAITAAEQGKAEVEKARATELVEKIKATTQAQKDFEVAQFQHKQAAENAAAEILKGEAEAKIARQKVAAGLTPEQKAQFAKDTAIGVAAELAKIQLPQLMLTGGSGKDGHSVDPFTAIGIENLMRINEKLSKTGN